MQLGFPRARVTLEHGAMASPPDLIFAQLRRAQNLKVDGVIEVMTVICDLVREIRHLRLQRRAMIFFSSRCWELVKRLMFLQTLAHFERQIQTREIWIGSLQQLHHS